MIINKGRKGGNKYQLWKRAYGYIKKDMYCQFEGAGTLDECKERAE